MKNIKILIIISIIGILSIGQDYKINKLEKQPEEKEIINIYTSAAETAPAAAEVAPDQETKEENKKENIIINHNNHIKEEITDRPEEAAAAAQEPGTTPGGEPKEYTIKDYINYINYKNKLIKQHGKGVYNLMNQEAGISSEKESFIYYMKNGI